MLRKPVAVVVQDARRPLKKRQPSDPDLYPVRLRVTFKIGNRWQQRYYPTGNALTVDDFKKAMAERQRSEALRKIRRQLNEILAKADAIIEANPLVTPTLFRMQWSGSPHNMSCLIAGVKALQADCEKDGQMSLADIARSTWRALEEFTSQDIPLEEVTPKVLQAFHNFLLAKPKRVRKKKNADKASTTPRGLSINTVRNYMCVIRRVFVQARRAGAIPAGCYPFDINAGGYQIPQREKLKRALEAPQLAVLLRYKPTKPLWAKALAEWKFSYYSNGMNFADIAYLQESNRIAHDILSFYRRKTLRTRRRQVPIQVILHPEAIEILDTYGTHRPYLFGIIDDTMTEKEKKKAIQSWISRTNYYLKEIAAHLGINMNMTTYVARHTHASTLLDAGANPKDIMDQFGHSSLEMVEVYLRNLTTQRQRSFLHALSVGERYNPQSQDQEHQRSAESQVADKHVAAGQDL